MFRYIQKFYKINDNFNKICSIKMINDGASMLKNQPVSYTGFGILLKYHL